MVLCVTVYMCVACVSSVTVTVCVCVQVLPNISTVVRMLLYVQV